MKKVRYVATMVIEFEVDAETEKKGYPNGVNQQALEEEMKSDIFPELFEGEVNSFKAEGFVMEAGEVIAHHKEVLWESSE